MLFIKTKLRRLTYLVFGPLTRKVEGQLHPVYCSALLEVEAVVVGEAGGRANGDLLAPHDGFHGVGGGDAGLDHHCK